MSKRLIYFGNSFPNEEKVLRDLDKILPPEYKILANLRINDPTLGEVEYDAIVLGKYAAYVLEIKNYGGLIKGDARNWEVQSKNNRIQSFPNPFYQLGRQVSIFVSRLKEAKNKVLVQGFVCLSSDTEPTLDIQDSEAHLNAIFWYKNATKFLTDPAALTLPADWGRKNILPRHDALLESIRTGFSPRKIENIPGYTIESDAWIGRRYKAYFAKREKAYPPKVLLKVYDVPEVVSSPEEIKRFVDQLNTRDFYALRKIEKTGDQSTGGQPYVLAGEGAFVHPLRNRSYVVAMEWMNGKPLSSCIIHPENFTFQIRCLIAAQICRGLAFVHSASVVHRNLSLDNIIWSTDENKVKIINFDFAKFTDDAISTVDDKNVLAVMQKELQEREKYQAPELCSNETEYKDEHVNFIYHRANISTDIYALGVVLLELFTGIIDPGKASINERIGKIADSPEIQKLISSCCSEKPGERPTSLVDATQLFENLAGIASPAYDLTNLPSGYRLGIYAIVSQITKSLMSVVYRAENTWTKQQVVIKIPRSPSRQDAQNELLRAMEILNEIPSDCTARLLHTDIAFLSGSKVHKDWTADAKEVYYQVWEYIDGENLKTFLSRNKPELDDRIKILSMTIGAVALLHEKGWIHQDIKPENFMSTADGHIKIIDFGLTKRISDIQDEPTGGTPGCYLPPEILEPNGKWTQSADVWSLGCLALVILFGEKTCTSRGLSISWDEVEKKFGPEMARVFQKATDAEPAKRYASAQEFLNDFEKAHADGQNRNQGKVTMDYGNILEQLKQKRDNAEGVGDMGMVDAISADVRALEKWLASGQKGDCPIDLRAYQIGQTVPASENVTVPDSSRDQKVQSKQAVPEKVEIQETPGETSVEPVTSKDMDSIASAESDRQQESFRQELEKVRQHIQRGEWHEAVARARQVEGLAQGEVKETARDLLSRAQVQFNKKLEKALADGDAARAKDNTEKAQKYYQAVLDLDPKNQHARSALQELDGLVGVKVSKELLNGLRAGLKERKDLGVLGNAVYEAEALDGQGKLSSEFQELLQSARKEFDELRQRHGEETTQLRFGDLAAKSKASYKIRQRLVLGEKVIYDATIDKNRPVPEVLRESDILREHSSADTANYFLNWAEKNKNYPKYVFSKLDKILEPLLDETLTGDKDTPVPTFIDQHRTLLTEKLDEVRRNVVQLEKAEALQSEARNEEDPVKRFSLLTQAASVFKNIPGLDEQLAQARQSAISLIQTQVSDLLRSAELSIRNQEYSEARSTTNGAEVQAAKWPEQQAPEEIARLLQEAKALRQQIDATENAWKEYNRLAADIRQKVVDQNQRSSALALFKQVSDDARFSSFLDLRMLTSEIDQYKGAGEQLNDAHTARAKNDWSRVFEIADKVLKAGTAGKLAARFQELHDDAVTELNILRAQELLESDEIPEANNVLSATLHKERERGPERESVLRERLHAELARVQQAIQGNKSMQALYDEACDLLSARDSIAFKAFTNPAFALRQSRVGTDGEVNSPEMRALINRLKDSPKDADPSPQELSERVEKVILTELVRRGVNERLKALRLFRYVGGDKIQSAQDGWPSYELSLRTAEARRAARLMSDSLRADVFEPLVQKYKDLQGKEDELKDETLRGMAGQSAALREAYLLETENERAIGRWAEVEWGKRHARQQEKESNWQNAVVIWTSLDNHHPGVPTVKRGLRNARIQSSINQAYYLVHNDHKGKEAINLLKDLLSEPDTSNSWELHLALAETYEDLGEFDSAFGNLDQAQRVIGGMDDGQQRTVRSQLEQKRRELETQQVVYTCSEMAKNKVIAGNPAEAIRILQSGIENPKVGDTAPLLSLRDEIFTHASQELLQRAKQEQDKGSDEGKVQAVTALVDLQILEELVGQPKEKRRSTSELNRLRTDLAPVADAVIRAALDFDPTTVPLSQAIDTASSLSARLQTFDNVIPLFGAELEPVRERLAKRHRDIASILENLRTLERILREASNQSLWESAIRTGDFEILEQYLARINRLELNALQEVRAFEKRLSETRETYQYLINVMGEVMRKFSPPEEDFNFVKGKIIGGKVQPPFRENSQSWQVVHAREYEDIRALLDDRLHVPDIYGRGDLIGWQKLLEQADEREKELELWKEWDRQCAFKMEAASQAVNVTEMHTADLPTRVKKMDWEKVLSAADAAISALSYSLITSDPVDQDKTRPAFIVGARDMNNIAIPLRSKAAKDIEEEGKRRRKKAEEWLHAAQTRIEALQAILDQRGFPSAEEFKSATLRSDWDYLEKLLVRAREAGITNENERMQVATYSKVLDQKRKEQASKKKWFNLGKSKS